MLFLLIFAHVVHSEDLLYITQLGTSRLLRGRHLFPSHSFPPSFYTITPSDGYAISFPHIHQDEINDAIQEVTRDNLLVKSVCSYSQGREVMYVMNVGSGEGRHEIALNLTMEQLQEAMKSHTENRVEVSYICVRDGAFDVVWHHAKNFVDHFIIHESPLPEVMEDEKEKGREGYYPVLVQPFKEKGSTHALVLWRKGFGVKSRLLVSSNSRQSNESQSFLSLSAIAPLDAFNSISVWKGRPFTWRGRSLIFSPQQGMLDMGVLDWEIESEMRLQEIPAISIAVLYDGKPLFAKGYGYADIIKEQGVLPSHRFRIASVSKTVTAMLIASLISEGKLSLNTRVFGPGGLLFPTYPGPANHYLRMIKIEDLLQHSSGAWSHFMKLEFAKFNCDIFNSRWSLFRRELKQDEYLRWILNNYQPRVTPGRVHIYSNIGYIFLGRVIEVLTKSTYEDYARKTLFEPLNIQGARIAKRTPLSDEVTYYSHDNASPYLSWDPERMDSAAGWTLTAVDVARVFDEIRMNPRYKILAARGWTRWTYGRGLQIGQDGSLFHVGSMAGSESIGLTRGRLSIAILTNVRGTNENWLTPWMENVARRLASRFG